MIKRRFYGWFDPQKRKLFLSRLPPDVQLNIRADCAVRNSLFELGVGKSGQLVKRIPRWRQKGRMRSFCQRSPYSFDSQWDIERFLADKRAKVIWSPPLPPNIDYLFGF